MSKLFGLEWKMYDNKRVHYLIAVHNAYMEKHNMEVKKQNAKSISYGRRS